LAVLEQAGKHNNAHRTYAKVQKAGALMTGESPIYSKIGEGFSIHETVNHSQNEYARAYFWHTNTVEGYFSLLKCAVFGTFHHVSEAHLHRYTVEQDFKWNTQINGLRTLRRVN
jgi:ISXO2-like transposase domain